MKSQKIKVQEFLKNNFAQSQANINKIVGRINSDNLTEFNTFLSELNIKITQQGDKIKDLRSWAYTSCIRFLAEWKERQDELDKERSNPIVENIGKSNATKAEHRVPLYSADDLAQWEQCLHAIRMSLDETAYNTWIVPIVLHSVMPEGPVVLLPSQFFYEYIVQHHADDIREAVKLVYGENKRLNFFIDRS